MKIIDIKIIEGCLEGDYVRDFLLDTAINQEFVDYLGEIGKIIIHELKPKPFFKVIVSGKYTIKGSIGNTSLRIILPDKFSEMYIDELYEYIIGFRLK